MSTASVLRRAITMAAALPLVLTATLVSTTAPADAKSDFSVKPFMGWSSWSVQSSSHPDYGTKWLTEEHIKTTADAMASNLKKSGYTNINLDAGWNANWNWEFRTDANGIPEADPERFPNGIASLARYVHSKGLKIGLYGGAGLQTAIYDKNAPIVGTNCTTQDITVYPLVKTNMWGGDWKIDFTKPCAQAYFDSIADKFASWGIDFLKVDGVLTENIPDVKAWSKAIDQSGRKMWLTASAWPIPRDAGEGLAPWANSVRVDTDVECYCNTVATWTSSVDNRWEDLPKWLDVVKPNYWPDLDSMPIVNNTGVGIQDGINDTERQSVMTFWSMASSPLYVGGDLANLDQKAKSILTNPEVIAVDQAGVIPTQVTGGTLQVWKKRLPGGRLAVAVYNLGDAPADLKVSWDQLGIRGNEKVRDLVSRKDLGKFNKSWTAKSIPAHGSRLITLS
ncbi:MAG TPA: glycoside hydrolase family 27 protein [Kribbella sp.]|uniref:glycoside hydrolase family 27 protein n=1 Tax=Kribbella sp. TaxID=1871183 RepID=UPI002D76B8B7|nr:glycoside hydrolase family 27 protein [Kribbella sp.]HET6292846.1 glycoside hydrolase family 27 protein [Kribbella sp.]